MAELLKLFYDLDEAEVLEIRTAALAAIKDVKPIMAVGGGGKTMARQFAMPPQDILRECNAALRHIAPETYGRRVRKTFSYFGRRGGDGL